MLQLPIVITGIRHVTMSVPCVMPINEFSSNDVRPHSKRMASSTAVMDKDGVSDFFAVRQALARRSGPVAT